MSAPISLLLLLDEPVGTPAVPGEYIILEAKFPGVHVYIDTETGDKLVTESK